jgi:hypothetical protein
MVTACLAVSYLLPGNSDLPRGYRDPVQLFGRLLGWEIIDKAVRYRE